MPDDVEKRGLEALERVGEALRDMAASMHLTYLLERERFSKQYPEKKEIRDALVTHPQTDEEKIRESQGDSDETDAEWVGQRERRFEEAEAAKAARQKKRRPTSSGRQ